jgi:hypothetical protein
MTREQHAERMSQNRFRFYSALYERNPRRYNETAERIHQIQERARLRRLARERLERKESRL